MNFFSSLGNWSIVANGSERFQKAQSELNSMFDRTMVGILNLHITNEFLQVGLPDSYKLSVDNKLDMFKHFSIWQGLGPGNGFSSFTSGEECAHYIAQREQHSAKTMIDASIFVFGYTLLDNAVTDFLRVLVLVAPSEFETYIIRRNISVETLKSQPVEHTLCEMLDTLVNEWDKQSINYRIERIYAVLNMGADAESIDQKQLKVLTDTRNEIIHGTGLDTDLPNTKEALNLFQVTHLSLYKMISKRYGLIRK